MMNDNDDNDRMACALAIEIAGIDGSGKTTLATAIGERLARTGVHSEVSRAHSWVRRWTNSLAAAHGLTRAQYFGQDAIELAAALEFVRSSLMLPGAADVHDVVILEPYVFNSAAIAAALKIGNLSAVLETYLKAAAPDLTVVLDLDPGVALSRIYNRPSADNFLLTESRDPFIYELRAAFDVVDPVFQAAGRTVVRLDGRRTVDENVERVLESIKAIGHGCPATASHGTPA